MKVKNYIMKKTKSLSSVILKSLMVFTTLLPLSLSAMDYDDSGSGPSSLRPANPVKSLEVLAAEEVVRPYVAELKEVLGRVSNLKQRMEDEENSAREARREAVRNRVRDLLDQGGSMAAVAACYGELEATELMNMPHISLTPQNDPIYRTSEGEVLYQELDAVLDKLLFVLDPDILAKRYHMELFLTYIPDTLARTDEIIPGLNEYKPLFIDIISSQLSSREKWLLPCRHLVSRVLHYDDAYEYNSTTFRVG